MNDIPPKHTPDDSATASGNLVSFYQAASNAQPESFPVLKAFQDYIEAERAQARKRVVSLSVIFAVIICAVIGGFLSTGIYLMRDRAQMQDQMMRDRTQMQDKILEIALAARPAAEPPVPAHIAPPAPSAAPQVDIVEKTVEEISKVTAALQSDIGKRIDGISEISSQVHEKVTSQETELEKLRQELGQMKEQNQLLKGDVEVMRTATARATPVTPGLTPPTVAVAVPPAPDEPPDVPGVVVVPPPPKEDLRFPPATKEPPATPDGVNPPDAPKGTMLTSVPLESKASGTIPWRVIIPE
ncbi:MAG: hypothetical protein FWG50_04240 [Kiritimatiellaeota bacterium]|nr:hypothetical protein [Kiritimatiellota bacterium]